jgi:hypothetical protein
MVWDDDAGDGYDGGYDGAEGQGERGSYSESQGGLIGAGVSAGFEFGQRGGSSESLAIVDNHTSGWTEWFVCLDTDQMGEAGIIRGSITSSSDVDAVTLEAVGDSTTTSSSTTCNVALLREKGQRMTTVAETLGVTQGCAKRLLQCNAWQVDYACKGFIMHGPAGTAAGGSAEAVWEQVGVDVILERCQQRGNPDHHDAADVCSRTTDGSKDDDIGGVGGVGGADSNTRPAEVPIGDMCCAVCMSAIYPPWRAPNVTSGHCRWAEPELKTKKPSMMPVAQCNKQSSGAENTAKHPAESAVLAEQYDADAIPSMCLCCNHAFCFVCWHQ